MLFNIVIISYIVIKFQQLIATWKIDIGTCLHTNIKCNLQIDLKSANQLFMIHKYKGHYLFVDCVAFIFRILAQLFRCFPIKKSTNTLLTICKQAQPNFYFQTTVKRHSYTFCAKLSMHVLNQSHGFLFVNHKELVCRF